MNLAKVRALLLIFQHVLALCLEVFLFDFVHQLSQSTASFPLCEQSPTAKFFKTDSVQNLAYAAVKLSMGGFFVTVSCIWHLVNTSRSIVLYSISMINFSGISNPPLVVRRILYALDQQKAPFIWPRVPETTLPPSYPVRVNFSFCLCLSLFPGCLGGNSGGRVVSPRRVG